MKLLYFDYAAVIILALLLFTTYCRGLTKGRLNKCYVELIVVCLISVVADILTAYGDNFYIKNLFYRYSFHYIYLLTHNATTPLFVVYLMIVTDTDYKMRGFKSVFYMLPFAAVFSLMCANPFTSWMFYINDNYEYVRGPLFFVLYISAGLYLYMCVYYIVRYGRTIGFRRSIGLGSVIPLLISAIAIQFFKPDLLMEMFAIAIGMFLIASLIHRPEDILDTETGFSNKTACIDDVNRCIHNKKPIEIILINIGNFDSLKSLLNSAGLHKLHRTIAASISEINKKRGTFSEMFYVGSGILCLEINYTKLADTEAAAEEINQRLHEPIIMNDMEIDLTPYVCIVKCPKEISDADTLTRFAEQLSLSTYTGEVMHASEVFKKDRFDMMQHMDTIIENALSNHLFKVYYQPIYNIHTKTFNSAEALIRLIDRDYGFIPPDVFIPMAEKSGAIHRIGAFVLDEVCTFIESDDFKQLGIDYIEVNLSVAQCMRNNLTDEIKDIMAKHNVSPSQINLEITETTATYSQDALKDNVKNLHDAGINFSLDDYGSGYSNIERISTMVFDIIKLDKTFVNVANSKNHDIILKHTVSMIKELGMKIVVEGVETKELLDRFAKLGCDYIQGYYFSKPIPKGDFIDFVRKNNK